MGEECMGVRVDERSCGSNQRPEKTIKYSRDSGYLAFIIFQA